MITAMKIVALTAVGAVTLASGDGCDDSHTSAPDPTPGSFTNVEQIPGNKMHGAKMPDGYRNIIVFCDGPNMVYETSRGDSGSTAEGTSSTLYVVPNDPRCAR